MMRKSWENVKFTELTIENNGVDQVKFPYLGRKNQPYIWRYIPYVDLDMWGTLKYREMEGYGCFMFHSNIGIWACPGFSFLTHGCFNMCLRSMTLMRWLPFWLCGKWNIDILGVSCDLIISGILIDTRFSDITWYRHLAGFQKWLPLRSYKYKSLYAT